jgi:Domain of unknown function (DUF4304)
MSVRRGRRVVSSTTIPRSADEEANQPCASAIARCVLNNRGFKKSGHLYTHKAGKIIQMVEVQRSRWNDRNMVAFTLNGGIHVSGVTSTFRRKPEPEQPGITDCCITVRVGMLGVSKLDIWWKLSANNDPDHDNQVAEEITSATTGLVLPFLDRFQSEEQVTQFLSQERGPRDEFVEPRVPALRHAYAALLWARLGAIATAHECLDRAQSESRKTPLEDVVARFAKRWKEEC